MAVNTHLTLYMPALYVSHNSKISFNKQNVCVCVCVCVWWGWGGQGSNHSTNSVINDCMLAGGEVRFLAELC